MSLIGKSLAHYSITAEIGKGGMGEVYRAKDQKLGRDVAIKVLPEEFAKDADRVARFQREAKLLASISHPNIAGIHGLEEFEGTDFLVLELVGGDPLSDRLKSGPIDVENSLSFALQIATALEAAHRKGIIHRDLKPSNIIVTDEGSVKLLDFGLAKLYEQNASISTLPTADMPSTQTGAVVGTVAYMSPEQVQGRSADARSDIFSFGLVLYEMLSGRRTFLGDSNYAVMNAIVKDDPPPLQTYPPIEKIVGQCLAKKASARYQTMSEVKTALEQVSSEKATGTGHVVDIQLLRQKAMRPRVFIPGLLILIALCGLVGWFTFQTIKVNWAREQALPEITRHLENRNYSIAYDLAIQAEKYIPDDPTLKKIWPEISALASIQTTPQGADVYMKEYSAVSDDWQYLGRSPLEKMRIPLGYFRWKISKPGYIPVEIARSATSGNLQANDFNLNLYKEGSAPQAMVQVPEGSFSALLAGIGPLGPVPLGEYWIDKYEVTNREFKEFVDQGGYEKREYWKNQFVKDGRDITWEQAMAEFRDATGRPGPAGWEAGGYPTGQEDFPVAGVSWYEAAAYAEFAGKRLPTIYDWYKAAQVSTGPFVVPLSNYSGDGPERVGVSQGVGPFGTYDMAGNVKEWCWNEDNGKRYILGGGWNEPTYMFGFSEPRDPFNRSSLNGFRCVKYAKSEVLPALMASVPRQFRDYSKEKAVSDQTFRIYESLYTYDRTDLNPKIESDDVSQYWRVQKITFDAAYGNERVIAHLFLPRGKPEPYQTIILFPGANSIFERTSPTTQIAKGLDYLIKNGRAVMLPVYKGLYERGFNRWSGNPAAVRDRLVQWRKDLGKSIDYVESRKDLDSKKLAYCGMSLGAQTGAILLALEKRFKAAILLDGGFSLGRRISDTPIPAPQLGTEQRSSLRPLPEADAINFALRVKIPVLMLNGRYDFIFPVEASQRPMFRALGTPENLKRHVILDTPHNVGSAGSITIRYILDWLDQYLGPAQ